MNFLNIGVTSGTTGDGLVGDSSCSLSSSFGIEEGRMIGAMPAVAVRHERRRQEKRSKRPSLLYLQSPLSRSPTPSPLQSPPALPYQPKQPEIYVCGKISVLHVVVVSLLLGAVLLIVGLVQLKPGADASHHRYLLLGTGSFLLLLGVVLAIVRCCILPWAAKRHHPPILQEDLPFPCEMGQKDFTEDPIEPPPLHLSSNNHDSEHLVEVQPT